MLEKRRSLSSWESSPRSKFHWEALSQTLSDTEKQLLKFRHSSSPSPQFTFRRWRFFCSQGDADADTCAIRWLCLICFETVWLTDYSKLCGNAESEENYGTVMNVSQSSPLLRAASIQASDHSGDVQCSGIGVAMGELQRGAGGCSLETQTEDKAKCRAYTACSIL